VEPFTEKGRVESPELVTGGAEIPPSAEELDVEVDVEVEFALEETVDVEFEVAAMVELENGAILIAAGVLVALTALSDDAATPLTA